MPIQASVPLDPTRLRRTGAVVGPDAALVRFLFLGFVITRIDRKPLAHVGPVRGLPIIFGSGVVQHVRTRIGPDDLIGAAMRFGLGFSLVLLQAATR